MTQLQNNFGVNNLALVDGKPKLLNLLDMITCLENHRKEVVIRRTKFDLKKAEERAHILEGLKIALDNIDEVIAIIKQSKSVDEARTSLIHRFRLSEVQAQAILDLRLQKLTSLETRKIIEELEEVRALIAYLKDILSGRQNSQSVKQETLEISVNYGDDRRTEIVPNEVEQINIEDLIQKEEMVALISKKGYIKRIPVSAYRSQGRGGREVLRADFRKTISLRRYLSHRLHDYLLFITTAGQAFWMKAHEIPEASRTAKGQHLKTLLQLNADEEISADTFLERFHR